MARQPVVKTALAKAALHQLRSRIAAIERAGGGSSARNEIVPLGIPAVDEALPGGGLARAALHEVAAPGGIFADGAAIGFATVLAARLMESSLPILWCLNDGMRHKRGDPPSSLYGPGLAAFGLDMDRVVIARTRRDLDTLWAMEEGLRTPALAAVIGEVMDLDLKASRRLQLAAESHGITALLLRPDADRLTPGAAVTRWRLDAAPKPAGPEELDEGVAEHPVWQVDLIRCRGGRPRSWRLVWRGPVKGLRLAEEVEPSQQPRALTG